MLGMKQIQDWPVQNIIRMTTRRTDGLLRD